MSEDGILDNAEYWYNEHLKASQLADQFKRALVLVKIHSLQQQHEEVVNLVDSLISKEEFNGILKKIIEE